METATEVEVCCHWTDERAWLEARGVSVSDAEQHAAAGCLYRCRRCCPRYYRRLDAQPTSLRDTATGDRFVPNAFGYLEFRIVPRSDVVHWEVAPCPLCTSAGASPRPRREAVYFRAAARASAATNVPESIALTRDEGDDSLTIRRKWCSSRGDLVGRLFWPTFILSTFSFGVTQEEILEYRFKVLLISLFGSVWSWLVLTYSRNSTVITIRKGGPLALTVRNGPYRIKFWHAATFDLEKVCDIFCARSVAENKWGTGNQREYYESFGVNIIERDVEGKHRRVIGHLQTMEEALCIQQAIKSEIEGSILTPEDEPERDLELVQV